MNTFILPLLMAAPQTSGAEGAAPSLMTTFLPFVLIIVIVYFLMIRPQNKKRKETEKMLAAIKKGDKIVTIGGLHGTIQTVKESTVIIKVPYPMWYSLPKIKKLRRKPKDKHPKTVNNYE